MLLYSINISVESHWLPRFNNFNNSLNVIKIFLHLPIHIVSKGQQIIVVLHRRSNHPLQFLPHGRQLVGISPPGSNGAGVCLLTDLCITSSIRNDIFKTLRPFKCGLQTRSTWWDREGSKQYSWTSIPYIHTYTIIQHSMTYVILSWCAQLSPQNGSSAWRLPTSAWVALPPLLAVRSPGPWPGPRSAGPSLGLAVRGGNEPQSSNIATTRTRKGTSKRMQTHSKSSQLSDSHTCYIIAHTV